MGTIIPDTRAVLGGTPDKGCVAPHYRLIALPLLPTAINAKGQIAGTTGAHRAALWSQRTGLQELPLPADLYNSEAVAINDSGHVLLMAYDRTFSDRQGYVFADGRLTRLSGEKSRGFRINNSDEVAGEALAPDMRTTEPVYWSRNQLRRISACCGGSALDISERGESVGDVYDAAGRYSAFLWTPTRGMQQIGPPNRYSSAIAVNENGHVVVQAVSEVFLYGNEGLVRLALSPKFPSHPRALNNCDVIVGSYGPFSDADRAFLWEKSGGFQDLNALIAPDSGWKLQQASGINERGAIVGRGDYRGEVDRGFLLVPGD